MTAEVFSAALGIEPPWSVTRVDFDQAGKLLTIQIDFKPGSRFSVPIIEQDECAKRHGDQRVDCSDESAGRTGVRHGRELSLTRSVAAVDLSYSLSSHRRVGQPSSYSSGPASGRRHASLARRPTGVSYSRPPARQFRAGPQ